MTVAAVLLWCCFDSRDMTQNEMNDRVKQGLAAVIHGEDGAVEFGFDLAY